MTNRIEWLKARQKGIGGSDVAAILGINPYRTPLDIYREKTTEITEDRAPSEAAYWGTQLESIVAQEFSKRTGFMIQRVYHQLASNLDHYILKTVESTLSQIRRRRARGTSGLWPSSP